MYWPPKDQICKQNLSQLYVCSSDSNPHCNGTPFKPKWSSWKVPLRISRKIAPSKSIAPNPWDIYVQTFTYAYNVYYFDKQRNAYLAIRCHPLPRDLCCINLHYKTGPTYCQGLRRLWNDNRARLVAYNIIMKANVGHRIAIVWNRYKKDFDKMQKH